MAAIVEEIIKILNAINSIFKSAPNVINKINQIENIYCILFLSSKIKQKNTRKKRENTK